MSAYEGEIGRCFRGSFELWIGDSPVEELTRLEPRETDRGLLARGRHVLAQRHDAGAQETCPKIGGTDA